MQHIPSMPIDHVEDRRYEYIRAIMRALDAIHGLGILCEMVRGFFGAGHYALADLTTEQLLELYNYLDLSNISVIDLEEKNETLKSLHHKTAKLIGVSMDAEEV